MSEYLNEKKAEKAARKAEKVAAKKEKKLKAKKARAERPSRLRNFFFLFARAIAFLPRIIFFPAKVIGKERLPKNARYIAVSNHLSWADLVYTLFTLPGRRFILAKKELSKSRFLRFVANWVGIVFVDRGNTDLKTLREIFGILKRGEALEIFPEGTRNRENRELLEIKSGSATFAIKSDAPIIPVMIYKKAKAFRRNYIYVGNPLDLSEYKGKKLTEALVAEAGQKVREAMLTEMANMDDYVQNKRWKKKNRLPVAAQTDAFLENPESLPQADNGDAKQ